MSHIIHRNLKSQPLLASGAKGVHIFDSQGKAYLDACGGAAVSCLGHAHPDVLAAMHAQIDKLAYAHTSFFTSDVSEELADHLVAHAPKGLSNVYFVSGGSEAMEAALKLARQYFVEIGQPERTMFIARRQSYHGNTLGALAVGETSGAASSSLRSWRMSAVCRRATNTGIALKTRLKTSTPQGFSKSWMTRFGKSVPKK